MRGHLWRTRNEEFESDQTGIRRVLENAFETTAEADLVDALRQDPAAWVQNYSIVAAVAALPDSGLETGVAAHAVIHKCHVGDSEGWMLAPSGVLPQHFGEGAGTAVINAALEEAEKDDVPFVLVFGWPNYYPRFGFQPASEFGITGEFAAGQPEALQIKIMNDAAQIPSGEVKLPAAYGVN